MRRTWRRFGQLRYSTIEEYPFTARTSLKSWFYAVYPMSSTRWGISAKQLERELGVTYQTVFKQIRPLLGEEVERLTGPVEADETYVGGRRRGTPRGRPGKDSHKTTVGGVVQPLAWAAPHLGASSRR